MSQSSKRFRSLIADPQLLVLPGAYDALSARIIESQGFDALVAGGYAAVGSMLGQPDMGQSNMRDFADHYARIAQAVSIPVYVDADTGFGGVHNVRQAVRTFEAAGVAGFFMVLHCATRSSKFGFRSRAFGMSSRICWRMA